MVTETETLSVGSETYLDQVFAEKTLTAKSLTVVQPKYAVMSHAALFTEAGAGTYTWEAVLPAGAILLNCGVQALAVWTAATSAVMDVGVKAGDVDGYFAAIDLKITDLTIGQSLDFARDGGKGGALLAATHANDRYSATARTIQFVAVSVGAGTAGRTYCWVEYMIPTLEAATKA